MVCSTVFNFSVDINSILRQKKPEKAIFKETLCPIHKMQFMYCGMLFKVMNFRFQNSWKFHRLIKIKTSVFCRIRRTFVVLCFIFVKLMKGIIMTVISVPVTNIKIWCLEMSQRQGIRSWLYCVERSHYTGYTLNTSEATSNSWLSIHHHPAGYFGDKKSFPDRWNYIWVGSWSVPRPWHGP